jgi:hypothetical protein
MRNISAAANVIEFSNTQKIKNIFADCENEFAADEKKKK